MATPRPVLAIDQGLTTTGWAVLDQDTGARLAGGAIHWKVPAGAGNAAKYDLFDQWVNRMIIEARPVLVVYEQVAYHSSPAAAHVYGGLQALIELACHRRRVRCQQVHWSQAKAMARKLTGIKAAPKRVASKEQMMQAAKLRWKLTTDIPHDESDALWIAEAARRGMVA